MKETIALIKGLCKFLLMVPLLPFLLVWVLLYPMLVIMVACLMALGGNTDNWFMRKWADWSKGLFYD